MAALKVNRKTKEEKRTLHARNVTIDDLHETNVTIVRRQIKGLSLDTGRVHGLPFQVIAGDLRVRDVLCFFSDGPDSRRAIDGLLCAGDVGQPGDGENRIHGLAETAEP